MKPTRDQALHAVRTLLTYAGDNPDRDGLVETPHRVIKALEGEWFSGYREDPAEILKTFERGEPYDGIVFQGNIPTYSWCEHHMAQILGVAHFAYIPDGHVVGLSKIARLIQVFSRRLQVQERLTRQVVDAFVEHVSCRGCALVMELRHMCMEARGVRIPGTLTTTTALRGIFVDDPATQAEFSNLINRQARRQ